MTLVNQTYGKGRVRVLRLNKTGDRHEVRELTVKAMMQGDFDRVFTHADNATAVSTDTVKNLINVVARENLGLDTEDFCQVACRRFLAEYPQVSAMEITASETKWVRHTIDGTPHPHGFTLDANGKPFATVTAARGGPMTVTSGLSDYTFMKTTESGWDKYVKDRFTTIPETRDRLCATAMEASWHWRSAPADYAKTNALVLDTMLEVFMTTYSESVQDSLYRMGTAVLDVVPEIETIHLACPNKHYLLINLKPFDLSNDNQVFLPTDEPHGQIECTIGRG